MIALIKAWGRKFALGFYGITWAGVVTLVAMWRGSNPAYVTAFCGAATGMVIALCSSNAAIEWKNLSRPAAPAATEG